MAKGSQFERDTCRELSRWWMNGLRDDVFWRSSQSGGRATVRGRKGKTTAGHYGDVCATDPIGVPFLDLTCVELKCGYNSEHIHALMDRPKQAAQGLWEQWIQQAVDARELSGSYAWMIIAKRDSRDPIVVMDRLLATALKPCWKRTNPTQFAGMSLTVRFRHEISRELVPITKGKRKGKLQRKPTFTYTTHNIRCSAMRWSDWLTAVTKADILKALEKC